MHRPPPAEGNDLNRLLNMSHLPNVASQAPSANNPVWPDEVSAAFCAVTPPIETFMDVPDEIRREQFFAVIFVDSDIDTCVYFLYELGIYFYLI